MKKRYRVKDAKDFKKVMNQGKNLRSASYLVFAKPNSEENLRVGISVSKKIGNAVIRAKVRRQIRAFFSVYNIYEKRYDIVIVVRSGFIKNKSLANREELKQKIDCLTTTEENPK